MLRLKLSIICFLFSALLSGCIHHLDVQQGNVISAKSVDQLKVGMTHNQVEALLGAPVLIQSFTDRVTYIYSWQSDKTPFHEKSLTLYFSNDHLTRFTVANK